MTSTNFYSDNPDIQFHVNKRLDFKSLFELLGKDDAETLGVSSAEEFRALFVELMETHGEVCAKEIAPNARMVEEIGLKLVDGEVILSPPGQKNVERLIEIGVPAATCPIRYGGMGMPYFTEMIGGEAMNRACPSTTLNGSWWGPIANMIDLYGTDELKERFIPRLASGEISGNMALTEAGAGSDLAALTTWAEKTEEPGVYKITGEKRFITNGHSEITLLLAKTKKGAKGLQALSLFVAERKIDGKPNYQIAKIEDKLGLKGSPTCELVFNASKAHILGEENKGYLYMLRLMNNSRIGVGFQGIGGMEGSLRTAREYASERQTWGKPIAKHELIAEKLLDMQVDVMAARSLGCKSANARSVQEYIYHALRRDDLPVKTRKEYEKREQTLEVEVRKLTPLLKYWVGEVSPRYARDGIQILGGYGFCKDYRAEWWLRESVIYSLYEGTSQIQALMCMKDTIKWVLQNPRLFMDALVGTSVRRIVKRDPNFRKILQIRQWIHEATMVILFRIVKRNLQWPGVPSISELPKAISLLAKNLTHFEDYQPAFLSAERLCEMKCYEAIATSLYEDYLVDSKREWVLTRFLYKATPNVSALKYGIDNEDPVMEAYLGNPKQAEEMQAAATSP